MNHSFPFSILLIILTLISQGAKAQSQAEAPDNGRSIINRLSEPGSGITVTAPTGLLQRALPAEEQPESKEAAPSSSEETAGDEQEEEKVTSRPKGKVAGYRVQVYADNNVRSAKTEARQRERAIGQAFPDYSTYVSYASPYWRLRVGDFRSNYEAEKAAAEIRRAFPRYAKEVRVVRDHVIIR